MHITVGQRSSRVELCAETQAHKHCNQAEPCFLVGLNVSRNVRLQTYDLQPTALSPSLNQVPSSDQADPSCCTVTASNHKHWRDLGQRPTVKASRSRIDTTVLGHHTWVSASVAAPSKHPCSGDAYRALSLTMSTVAKL